MATSLVCAAAIDAARHAAMAALAAAPTQRPAPHMHTSITQQAHACSTAHYTHPAHGTSCFALPSRPANLHLRRIAMLASHPPHCAATAHRRAALLDLPATVAAPGPPDAPRRGPDSSRAPEPTVLWGSRPRAARHFASARLRERRRSSPAQRRAALGHVRVRGRAPRALEAPGVGALWAGGVAPFHGLVLRALVLDRSLGCGGARPTRHTTCMALHDAWRLHRPSPSYFLYFADIGSSVRGTDHPRTVRHRRADAVVQHGAARWRHGTGLFAPTRHPWLKALCRMCAPLRPCSNSHIAGGDDVVLAYACAIAALQRRAAVGGPQFC
jgi:hypothetical protein